MGKQVVPHLYPHIERLLQDKSKLIIAAMGRRTGKTAFIAERIRRLKRKNALVITPNVESKASILRMFPKYKLLKSSMTGNKYLVYGKELTLATYAEWLNSGVDYSKENLGIVIADEAAYANESILARLKKEAPEWSEQFYIIGTPKRVINRHDNTVDEFNYTVLYSTELGYTMHITSSAAVLSTEELDSLQEVVSEEIFERDFLVKK